MICTKCNKEKSVNEFSTYKHPSTKSIVTIKTCKDCVRKYKRGGSNPRSLMGEKKKCHNCGVSFTALSKFNILCGICKELDCDELYNVCLDGQ